MTADERAIPLPDGGAGSAAPPASRSDDDGPAANRGLGTGPTEPVADGQQELLLEIVRRRPVLQALRSGPAGGSELARSVDLSRSTVHRATNSLEEHNLVAKSDGEYELTRLGRVVAEKVATFRAEVGAAQSLEPFLNTIDMDGFPTEHFIEARITRPTPRQPHMSIQRIIELIEGSDTLRMLSTVLSPLYVDVGYREMRDGMEIEAVFDEEVIDIMVSQYTHKAYETIEMGNFSVYAHQGLPFELFILDDKIGMAAHDENGVARVLIECESAAALDWAEALYVEHRAEAVPLELSEL